MDASGYIENILTAYDLDKDADLLVGPFAPEE